jgi:hypothetical protein
MYTEKDPQRRDSLSHSTPRQRPRLLRSSVTEPSITASGTIHASLVTPNSPRRAAELLTKAVVYIPASCGVGEGITAEHYRPQITDTVMLDSHVGHGVHVNNETSNFGTRLSGKLNMLNLAAGFVSFANLCSN